MISHHHECIFVHIPKCGGQSVEAVFLEDLGIAWENGGPFWMLPNRNPAIGPPRLAHLSAEEYVACGYVPEAMFRRYLTFTVVRNPWTRAVSLYRYTRYYCSFAKFLDIIATRPERSWWFVRPQVEFLERDGAIAVDEVLRLESLDADFAQIRDRLGLRPPLRHLNAGEDQRRRLPWKRKEVHARWRDYYTPGTIEAVGNLYRRDIETFGYAFE